MPAFASVDAERAAEREERYQDQDRSFAEMCEWWCEKKKLSKNEFYTRANITRAAFWNMKHNPEQVPKKTNVLACAVGLLLAWFGLWLSMELCWLWVGKALTGLGKRLCVREEAA